MGVVTGYPFSNSKAFFVKAEPVNPSTAVFGAPPLVAALGTPSPSPSLARVPRVGLGGARSSVPPSHAQHEWRRPGGASVEEALSRLQLVQQELRREPSGVELKNLRGWWGTPPPPPPAPSFAPLCQHPSLLPPPSSSPLPLRLPPSLPARDLPLRSVSPRVFSPSHCHTEAAASFRALRVLRLPVSSQPLLWAPARHAKMPRARSWPRHSRFVSSHPHPQHV